MNMVWMRWWLKGRCGSPKMASTPTVAAAPLFSNTGWRLLAIRYASQFWLSLLCQTHTICSLLLNLGAFTKPNQSLSCQKTNILDGQGVLSYVSYDFLCWKTWWNSLKWAKLKCFLLKGGFLYSKKGNQVMTKEAFLEESCAFSLGPIILWGFSRNPAHQVYLLTLRNRTSTYVVLLSTQPESSAGRLLQSLQVSVTATSLVLIKQSWL